MKKKDYILILLSFILCSCLDMDKSGREKIVNKESLWDYDYRLFQSTPVWNLAKAVEDGDEDLINEILTKNPKLVDFQEPSHKMTLLMLTILNQRKATFPYSLICANQQCGLKLNESQWRSFCALLKNDASVNIADSSGRTALLIACGCDYYDAKYVKELIKHGADVNYICPPHKTNRKGDATPLLNAVRCNNLDMVKLLVKNGADINYVDKYNNTALGMSLFDSKYDITMYLLENGADYTIPVSQKSYHTFGNDNDTCKLRIEEELRYDVWPLHSKEYKLKMQIVNFLKKKNINYRTIEIPQDVIDYAKEEYPTSWKYYLDNY